MWRVSVSDACIGSESCVALAPGHFGLGTDRRAHPVAADIPPEEAVLDAAISCPVEAITVLNRSTGEPVEF